MFLNPARSPHGPTDRARIGVAHAAQVRALLALCPAHAPTPLLALPALAAELGVAEVWVKAEGGRMGLGSFKALGGAHAVALRVMARAQAVLGRAIAPGDLAAPDVRRVAAGVTLICASAGNHGLAVAAGAKAFGARAVVVLAQSVPEVFAVRLRAGDATVIRAGAGYEASMAFARDQAGPHGWDLISDSSWPGYVETALEVMRGYTVLLAEAAEALDATGGPATHVFVQAGVGGLAAAAAGYLRDRWGDDVRLVVVEPQGAPCLLESAQAGRPVGVETRPTILGRLDCAEPSLVAFEMLSRLADGFMTITDAEAQAAAARLIALGADVSPCGATGAAGLIVLAAQPDIRRSLGLDPRSRVLLIGTEAGEAPTQGPKP